jgi:hypothetical protein
MLAKELAHHPYRILYNRHNAMSDLTPLQQVRLRELGKFTASRPAMQALPRFAATGLGKRLGRDVR